MRLPGPAALLSKSVSVLAFPLLMALGGYLKPKEREKIEAAGESSKLASRR